MSGDANLKQAIARLRGVLVRAGKGSADYQQIVAAEPEVLARYQPVFSPEAIASLSEEEFREFLKFENNRHWWFMPHHGPKICADMDLLRAALSILVDESRPIEDRLDQVLPKSGKPMVPYVNRALITAILLITSPAEYGVWNSTSEGSLKALGILPRFPMGAPFSQRYATFNGVLKQLAAALEIDLWALDSLHWVVVNQDMADAETEDEDQRIEPVSLVQPGAVYFHLEKYLHQFMRDNWDSLELGKDWALHEEDGELVGYEYAAGYIGYIDLLAHHRTEPRWLVVELKRGQSSDGTVGQVLRYIGWVQEQLAAPGEMVEGLIVAHGIDDKLRYALKPTCNIGVKLYEVDFRLRDPE